MCQMLCVSWCVGNSVGPLTVSTTPLIWECSREGWLRNFSWYKHESHFPDISTYTIERKKVICGGDEVEWGDKSLLWNHILYRPKEMTMYILYIILLIGIEKTFPVIITQLLRSVYYTSFRPFTFFHSNTLIYMFFFLILSLKDFST